MATTINHTRRKKLDRGQYEITIEKGSDGIPSFQLTLNELDKSIERSSRVFVEANTRNTLQRFDFGTLDEFKSPANTRLDKLSATEPPRFRVLIVDYQGGQSDALERKGRIRAKASGIRGSSGNESENNSSLLVVSTSNLGEMVWYVKVGANDERPELCLNDKIPDAIHLLKTKPEYQALILPAAFRQVLTNYYLVGNQDDTDDVVQQQWWRLATSFAGREPPKEGDEAGIDDFPLWLDEAIEGFCKEHAFCNSLLEALTEPESK